MGAEDVEICRSISREVLPTLALPPATPRHMEVAWLAAEDAKRLEQLQRLGDGVPALPGMALDIGIAGIQHSLARLAEDPDHGVEDQELVCVQELQTHQAGPIAGDPTRLLFAKTLEHRSFRRSHSQSLRTRDPLGACQTCPAIAGCELQVTLYPTIEIWVWMPEAAGLQTLAAGRPNFLVSFGPLLLGAAFPLC
jgi:hypothetical protein